MCYNAAMSKEESQEEKLNKLTKEELIALNKELNKQVDIYRERLRILTCQHFGKKSEAGLSPDQLSFDPETGEILNEAEKLVEQGVPAETEIEEVVVKRKKAKGKRSANLEGIEVEVIDHECPKEVLDEKFPKGWKSLPDVVYSELKYIPATFKVLEHHIKVYAGKRETDGVLRADAPDRLLAHSIVTPELAAAVINAKYVNGIPLNRLSEEFLRNGVNIPRQDMAGWMIRLNAYYLKQIHARMKEEIMRSHHVHCDETPFIMPKDGKEYMWVFHSPGGNDTHPGFLYEYLGARNGKVITDYLSGYKGYLITDGYQPYHTLDKNSDEIAVSGCWAHSRRKFADIIKAAGKKETFTPSQAIAAEAVQRIDRMYHLDNKYKDSSDEDRLKNREDVIKPLVDDFFVWIKEQTKKTIANDSLKSALNYAANQEKYLRVFLEDAQIPLDNNDAERSIKQFCVGKKNWQIIASMNGARASAMLYSIAESAKANGLNPYEYFSHMFTELAKYPRNGAPEEIVEELMPWSDKLPDKVRKTKTR